MVCIYHNRDLDGLCSGAIVKKKYPDCKLIGYDYGQPFPWSEIPKGEPVIMADVSLPMEEMIQLASWVDFKFTWIDHHKSAIKDYEEYKELIGKPVGFLAPVLQDGVAACELTWQHLFPDEPMPEAVQALGMYDTWRNEDKAWWDNIIMPFQYGMRATCGLDLEKFPMNILVDEGTVCNALKLSEIKIKGAIVLDYQKQLNEENCRRNAYEVTFEGLRAICLNSNIFNSQVFESVYDPEKHDIMIPYQFDGTKWRIGS